MEELESVLHFPTPNAYSFIKGCRRVLGFGCVDSRVMCVSSVSEDSVSELVMHRHLRECGRAPALRWVTV